MTWGYRRLRRITLAPSIRGGEIREPASWLLAIIALSLALGGSRALSLDFYAGPTFVGILLGFTAHEIAHRQVSRMYGASAEFVAFTPGLLLTLISAVLPFKILAPGYVKITTWRLIDPRGVFYSVAAGPATNIVIAAALLAAAVTLADWKGYLLSMASVNAYLAVFNLLPITPLDGEKIFKYNTAWWAALIALAIAVYLASARAL